MSRYANAWEAEHEDTVITLRFVHKREDDADYIETITMPLQILIDLAAWVNLNWAEEVAQVYSDSNTSSSEEPDST